MKYFKIDARMEVVAISDSFPAELKGPESAGLWWRGKDGFNVGGWLCRVDIDSFMMASALADSASKLAGELYIPVDSGPGVSPRFDVIRAPAIGDKVSKAFNGDYYPCGVIFSISKSLRLVRSRDEAGREYKFYRDGNSGRWANGRYWGMVGGHIDRWNPEF